MDKKLLEHTIMTNSGCYMLQVIQVTTIVLLTSYIKYILEVTILTSYQWQAINDQ